MELLAADVTATPITVLTGFLGAGKTTLLNRILTADHGLRVGVLVNDFGSVNVDAKLVVGVRSGTVSLANGCVCCEIRDDLVDSVIALLDGPDLVDYIVLEASGVADPGGIVLTFGDPSLRDKIRLDSITCVVDADQVFAHPEYPPLMELKLRQVGFADMVILNKVQLAGAQQVEKVRSWLDENFNRLRVVETNHCEVADEILFGVGHFDPLHNEERCLRDPHGSDEHQHSSVFSSWSFETEEPMSLGALREALRRLPEGVYRAKGIVHAMEFPHQRVVVQVVGRRVDLSLQDDWDASAPCTTLVAIGGAGQLDVGDLDALFAGCIACAASGS